MLFRRHRSMVPPKVSMSGQLILDAFAVSSSSHASLVDHQQRLAESFDQNLFKGTIKDFGGSGRVGPDVKIRFTGANHRDLYAKRRWRHASGPSGFPCCGPSPDWQPMRPRTSHSRAMVPTARWLPSSLDGLAERTTERMELPAFRSLLALSRSTDVGCWPGSEVPQRVRLVRYREKPT